MTREAEMICFDVQRNLAWGVGTGLVIGIGLGVLLAWAIYRLVKG